MDFNYSETLTEITVDNYTFKVTWSVAMEECCILWIQDTDTMEQFEALGRFSQFDKRNILDFIVRYVTSHSLREKISKKRFSLYVESLSPTFYEEIQSLDYKEKVKALSNLFNLDSVIDEAADLRWKWSLMAKKFHPDVGGNKEAMALINEGYELLKSKKGKSF